MKTYTAKLELKGREFIAKVSRYADGIAHEYVRIADGATIHEAEFKASDIGAADWNEYTRVMLASVAEKFYRESRK